MVDIYVGKKQEDWISRLLRLIDDGHQKNAVTDLSQLSDDAQKFDALEQLAAHIENRTISRLRFRLVNLFALDLALELPFHISGNHTLISTFPDARVHIPAHAPVHPPHHALAIALVRILEYALAGSRERVSSLISARERNFAGVFDPALDHTLDLAHSRESDIATYFASALANSTALAIAETSASAFDFATALANDLGLVLARGTDYTFDFVLEPICLNVEILIFWLSRVPIYRNIYINIYDCYHKELANAFEESVYLQRESSHPILNVIVDVLKQITDNNLRYITLEGSDAITPDVLAYEIAPYLQALRDIKQVVFASASKKSTQGSGKSKTLGKIAAGIYKEPRIVQIHNESAKIDILGIADIIRAVNEVISLRKRNQDATLRDLQIENSYLTNDQLRLQNERAKLETQGHLQQMAIENDTNLPNAEKAVKIALLQEQIKQERNKTQMQELELAEKQWELERKQMREYMTTSVEMLRELFGREIIIEDFAEHLPKMTQAVKTMLDSRLTLRIGWHDSPRPPNLPEEH